MAPHSCLRLLRKISGFTNCPHPYRDDGKGGCIEKESGNLGCEWPWEDCGTGCCQIPIQLILFIIVIILTPPFLRSTVKKPATKLSVISGDTKPSGAK